MAGSLNKVTIIGSLGRDPEVRTTNDGKEIVNFSLATSESWKDKSSGEKKEKTEWHRVVVFSEGLTNVVKNYAKKGSKIYIEGSLQTRKWMDANGQEKYTTEIVLQNYNSKLILLDSKNSSSSTQDGYGSDNFKSGGSDNHFEHNELDDEIPF